MMGYGYDPFLSERSLKPPVFHTSTFVFRTAEDGKAFFELAYGLRQKRPNEEPGLIYSRINNPDLEVLEDRLAIWDEAEANLTFASGMAAISTTLWAYSRPGSVIVHSGPVYGGTDFLLERILPQFGVTSIEFTAESGTEAMEEAVNRARAIGPIAALYLETPANPTNGLVDIGRAREIADGIRGKDGKRPTVIVDNTMLGPLYQTPLAHGADLVITSLTKYVGGHSDLIAGGCSGAAASLEPIRGMRTILARCAIPHRLDADAVARNAQAQNDRRRRGRAQGGGVSARPCQGRFGLVSWLSARGPSGPYRYSSASAKVRARRSASRSKEARPKPLPFWISSKVIKLAVSLGGTETLASHPAAMTHSDIPAEERLRLGITPALIRISVGIENPDDLIADLDQALRG